MKKIILSLILFTFTILTIKAQNNEPTKSNFSKKIESMTHVTSIASRPEDQHEIDFSFKEALDGRVKTKNIPEIIIGKDPQKTDDYFKLNPNKLEQKISGRAVDLVIQGASSNNSPTDPALAVGPNHVILVFNEGFRIFDKQGNPLTNQTAPSPAIFTNSGCCDLTISYDNLADRWVMTYLGSGMQVAVSDGPDPINDGWNVYNVPSVSDYNKLSVWHDGYYVTQNGNPDVYALERSKMLLGDPSAQVISFSFPGIVTSGFNSAQGFNISNNVHPTDDIAFVYMQDDAWSGVTNDHIKLWTLKMNWAGGTGLMSAATEIPITPFISVFDGGSFSNLTQPNGGDIDALQATIMNQAQFRKFPNHNSALFNFVVDTDASAGELAGIRWVELRQVNDGSPWTLYQEGTYLAPNGKHAWNASLIMDYQGNIGMGYTGMGGANNKHVGMYYTGRFANDPLGTMTISEEIILEGNGDINGSRYGDYSKIDVDPTDDKTFWFADEMMNNGKKDVIGVFSIAPDFSNDLGIVSIDTPISSALNNNETVTVTVFNFGTNSQTNFPISLVVDGTAIATENYSGILQPATSAQFTFNQTINLSNIGQTYIIETCTGLANDEENTNNCNTTNVTNLEPNDIGVTAITAPVSAATLTATEQITVTITNFGGAAQSNFNVTYTLNGNSVTESVIGPLNANSSIIYTFNQTGNFLAIDTYNLSVTTSLPNDSDNTNDSTSAVIIKSNCQPTANCTSFGDGLQLFRLGTIDNTSDCDSSGYSDFTNLTTDLNQGSSNDLTLTTGWSDQYVNVWIDFNDDFTFSPNELVVDNFVLTQTGTEITTNLTIPNSVNLGLHLLRAKTSDSLNSGDSCANVSWGETEDYKVNITATANTDSSLFNNTDFKILSLDNNKYIVSVKTTTVNERLAFSVHNIAGQKLLNYFIDNKNGEYRYELDMSYAAPGVYILTLGNSKLNNTTRIIVK